MSKYICICIYVHKHIHIRVHVYDPLPKCQKECWTFQVVRGSLTEWSRSSTCALVSTRPSIHTYTYTYIYTYMPKYPCIYKYTYTCTCVWSPPPMTNNQGVMLPPFRRWPCTSRSRSGPQASRAALLSSTTTSSPCGRTSQWRCNPLLHQIRRGMARAQTYFVHKYTYAYI